MQPRTLVLVAAAAFALSACVDPNEKVTYFDGGGQPDQHQGWTEAGIVCKDPKADYDSDGIPDGEEGCLNGQDTDNDKTPDWQDFDSDGDGIPDAIEAGKKTAGGKCKGAKPGKDSYPCDTDGDKVPDYQDMDSDGDGLKDGAEDANGDGLLGCCLTDCGKPDTAWQLKNCILTQDKCGAGQTCKGGKCVPTVGFNCSEGETSARHKDTFGDGKLDIERGTYICRDATEDKPQGRKPVQLRTNTAGDWHIAIEKGAKYGAMTISGATAKMAAAAIDHEKAAEEVAGFVVSRETTKDKVQDELSSIQSAIFAAFAGAKVTVRASGTQGRSHDLYDTVKGTTVDITGSATDISSARNQVVAALLGKQLSSMTNLPAPYGSSQSSLVLRFTTVRRFELKKDAKGQVIKDAKGNPLDTGDKSKWRLMVIGAVAGANNYKDPSRNTGLIMDDLSNGTVLAIAADTVGNECDVGKIGKLPKADIIWVVDTSGSMYNNQVDVANNAANFFSRALSAGLDFRMAVQPACEQSKWCKGRFLLPSESTAFKDCIKKPGSGSCETGLASAKVAVKQGLPRTTNDPKKIRSGADLVIIQVTDELPQKVKSSLGYTYNTCTLSASQKTALDKFLQGYKDFYNGTTDPEAVGIMHAIAGVCNNSCGAEKGHGYIEMVQYLGGQMGDICQKNLGSTMQTIIDTITGQASPIKLDYVPISSSLAVAMDSIVVKRSRTNGFDYRSNANTLVFINVKYKKGSEVIASYKRWTRQIVLQ